MLVRHNFIAFVIIMNYQENDIDFEKIDWKQFEELCYDLLVKFGFHSMCWRQGGADSGRDIEAHKYITDTIVSPFTEKWFIECKRYSSGLPLDQITEKVEWARVEGADHFLLIVSSYLTQQTRDWLTKAKAKEHFKIHLIEGKFLKQQLLLFPELIQKYFADDYVKLVKSMLQQWVIYHVLPEAKALYDLYIHLDFELLNAEELAFLWHAFNQAEETLDAYCDDKDFEQINPKDSLVPFEFLVPYLIKAQNWEYPAVTPAEPWDGGLSNGLGQTWLESNGQEYYFSTIHYQLTDTNRIQVILVKENRILEVRVAYGKKKTIS